MTYDQSSVEKRAGISTADYRSRFSFAGSAMLALTKVERAIGNSFKRVGGALHQHALRWKPATELFYPYAPREFRYAFCAETKDDCIKLRRLAGALKGQFPLYLVSANVTQLAGFTHVPYQAIAANGLEVISLTSKASEITAFPHLAEAARGGQEFSLWDDYNYFRSPNRAPITTYRYLELHVNDNAGVVPPSHFSNWAYIDTLGKKVVRGGESVLDMFSGSGCIGLSLAKELPIASITLADANLFSVECIKRSARDNRLDQPCQVWLSDLFGNIPAEAAFDLIVGNPPHGGSDQAVDFATLAGDDHGWATHARFFREAHGRLRPGGRIALIEVKNSGFIEWFTNEPAIQAAYAIEAVHDMPGNFAYTIVLKARADQNR